MQPLEELSIGKGPQHLDTGLLLSFNPCHESFPQGVQVSGDDHDEGSHRYFYIITEFRTSNLDLGQVLFKDRLSPFGKTDTDSAKGGCVHPNFEHEFTRLQFHAAWQEMPARSIISRAIINVQKHRISGLKGKKARHPNHLMRNTPDVMFQNNTGFRCSGGRNARQAHHLTSNYNTHDLICTFQDRMHTKISHDTLHRVISQIAITAQQLKRPICYIKTSVCSEQFGNCCIHGGSSSLRIQSLRSMSATPNHTLRLACRPCPPAGSFLRSAMRAEESQLETRGA